MRVNLNVPEVVALPVDLPNFLITLWPLTCLPVPTTVLLCYDIRNSGMH